MLLGDLWTDCKGDLDLGVQARGTGWGWKEKLTMHPPVTLSPIYHPATYAAHLFKYLSKLIHPHARLPTHLPSQPFIHPASYLLISPSTHGPLPSS